MTRSEVLRDLYEALDLLDAAQRGGPRPVPVRIAPIGAVGGTGGTDGTGGADDAYRSAGSAGSAGLAGADGWASGASEPTIDLRDHAAGGGTVLPTAGGLRHQVRLRLGTDWDSTGRRNGAA